MDRPDNFSYWLTVEGSREDRDKVYHLLGSLENKAWGVPVLDDFLERDEPDPLVTYDSYHVDNRLGTISAWSEDSMDELLHSIAVQVPNAILEMEVIDEDDQSYGFHVRYHGDLYQKVYRETHLPPFDPDRNIPFDQRHSPEAYAQEKQKTMYVLYEVFEAGDAIRQFNILAMSEDKTLLRELMRKKIEIDDHDFIGDNGVFYEYKDHFSTNYKNGFVEYHIEEQPVYTQEHRKELLASRTFNKEYSEPYYFTFGSDGTQPYRRGWMEVHAKSYEDARALFRSKYPDKRPGIINCAGMYTKEQFHAQILPKYLEHTDWYICHEILTKAGSTYPTREETEKKLSLEKQISAANDRREDGSPTDTPKREPSL